MSNCERCGADVAFSPCCGRAEALAGRLGKAHESLDALATLLVTRINATCRGRTPDPGSNADFFYTLLRIARSPSGRACTCGRDYANDDEHAPTCATRGGK